MTNPSHNPARLVIAGAMYWNEDTQTMFRPIYTAETMRVEGYEYVQCTDEDATDTFNGDIYTDEGGDTYYYDGTGTTVVHTAVLFLQDDIKTLKDLL